MHFFDFQEVENYNEGVALREFYFQIVQLFCAWNSCFVVYISCDAPTSD